ncbi:MAG: hypothetical protein WBV46_11200 [Terriglobales bacterium]|jgi:hypothetical protein
MHKNRGIKTGQLDDGIGDTFVLALEMRELVAARAQAGCHTRYSTEPQYQLAANTIVQLIRWKTSRLMVASSPI